MLILITYDPDVSGCVKKLSRVLYNNVALIHTGRTKHILLLLRSVPITWKKCITQNRLNLKCSTEHEREMYTLMAIDALFIATED